MQTDVKRPSGRLPQDMRPIRFERSYTCHAEGSVLVCFGLTKVICTASIGTGVPGFLRGKGQGWLTAEYGMLPRSRAREWIARRAGVNKVAEPLKSRDSSAGLCEPRWI